MVIKNLKNMKISLKLFAVACMAMLFQSCYEDYKFDYDHTTAYFARQKPLRTLVDEENKDMKFTFGTVLAGVYSNEKNWNVYYEVQPELLEEYPDKELLPEEYYTLSNSNHIVVPEGNILGEIEVKIDKDKFMSDPKSLNGTYVLPVKITSCDMDSILENKDYSLIALKYFNKFHATYFLKGTDTKFNVDGTEADKVEYNSDDLVQNNRIHELTTLSKNSLKVPFIGRFNVEKHFMKISVDEDNNVSVEGMDGSVISSVTGSGKSNYDENNHPHFNLEYEYTDEDGLKHKVQEELIYLKTVLKLEEW